MHVYVRAAGSSGYLRRFHYSLECKQLRKKPARGTNHDTEYVDLRELKRVVPCKNCFPRVKHPKMARRFCPKCNKHSARACAHNGGVPVFVTKTTTYTSIFRDPGDTYVAQYYVWPDRAHLYYN